MTASCEVAAALTVIGADVPVIAVWTTSFTMIVEVVASRSVTPPVKVNVPFVSGELAGRVGSLASGPMGEPFVVLNATWPV